MRRELELDPGELPHERRADGELAGPLELEALAVDRTRGGDVARLLQRRPVLLLLARGRAAFDLGPVVVVRLLAHSDPFRPRHPEVDGEHAFELRELELLLPPRGGLLARTVRGEAREILLQAIRLLGEGGAPADRLLVLLVEAGLAEDDAEDLDAVRAQDRVQARGGLRGDLGARGSADDLLRGEAAELVAQDRACGGREELRARGPVRAGVVEHLGRGFRHEGVLDLDRVDPEARAVPRPRDELRDALLADAPAPLHAQRPRAPVEQVHLLNEREVQDPARVRLDASRAAPAVGDDRDLVVGDARDAGVPRPEPGAPGDERGGRRQREAELQEPTERAARRTCERRSPRAPAEPWTNGAVPTRA